MTGIQHLDLPDEAARAERQRPPRPLQPHRSAGHEHQDVRQLATAHQRLAGGEAPLVAAQHELLGELVRQLRQDLRLAGHALVAPAVEQQRPALAVPGHLDLAQEERVVAAPVGAHDSRNEMRQGPGHERCVAHDDELGLDAFDCAAGEEVGQLRLVLREDADAVAGALVEQRAHACAAVDRDEHERRLQRDRHERVRRHAVHLLADAGRQDRHAGREHPERPPEGE